MNPTPPVAKVQSRKQRKFPEGHSAPTFCSVYDVYDTLRTGGSGLHAAATDFAPHPTREKIIL
jgi:hypothetical protein